MAKLYKIKDLNKHPDLAFMAWGASRYNLSRYSKLEDLHKDVARDFQQSIDEYSGAENNPIKLACQEVLKHAQKIADEEFKLKAETGLPCDEQVFAQLIETLYRCHIALLGPQPNQDMDAFMRNLQDMEALAQKLPGHKSDSWKWLMWGLSWIPFIIGMVCLSVASMALMQLIPGVGQIMSLAFLSQISIPILMTAIHAVGSVVTAGLGATAAGMTSALAAFGITATVPPVAAAATLGVAGYLTNEKVKAMKEDLELVKAVKKVKQETQKENEPKYQFKPKS